MDLFKLKEVCDILEGFISYDRYPLNVHPQPDGISKEEI